MPRSIYYETDDVTVARPSYVFLDQRTPGRSHDFAQIETDIG